jgi:hypothetical protein
MAKQCYTHLSVEDRETLSLGLAHGHSLRTMASILGRAPSAVSREHTLASARVRHDGRANSWIPGCGSTSGRIWPRAARPSRLPGVSNARILTTCANSCRPRPSIWACMCYNAARCGANC